MSLSVKANAQHSLTPDSLLIKANSLYARGDYQGSLPYYRNSIKVADQYGLLKLEASAYKNMGNAYSRLGQAPQAIQNLHTALTLAEKIKDTSLLAHIHLDIGTVHSEQKDFDKASAEYLIAEKLAAHSEERLLMADCFNNLGVIYEQTEDYPAALEVYKKALAIYREEGKPEGISFSLNNLGIVNKYLKNYRESIQNYEEALVLSQKLHDSFMVAANLNNLGNVYALQGNFQKSLELCMAALDTAQKIEAQEIVIETYDGIAEAYEGLKNYPKAIVYRKLYEQEKNKFINKERARQLTEMEVKYNTQQKESKILRLSQMEKISRLELEQKNVLLVSVLIVLLLSVLGTYLFLRKQKYKSRLAIETAIKEKEESERLRMARDIHDDLGSGLAKINFLSELIQKEAPQLPVIMEGARAVSETSKKLVENMRDLIWALNPENTSLPSLMARIREYSSDYLEDFPAELQLQFPDQFPEIPISKEVHRAILMVIKESLQNIVKHSAATRILLRYSLNHKTLQLTIYDNGSGFCTKDPARGNGLRNMENRIIQAGGDYKITSEEGAGTSIEFSFPL